MIQEWLHRARHFLVEVEWGLGLLLGLLLVVKIIGRLVLHTTFISFGTILGVMVLYLIIVFGLRAVEIKLRK